MEEHKITWNIIRSITSKCDHICKLGWFQTSISLFKILNSKWNHPVEKNRNSPMYQKNRNSLIEMKGQRHIVTVNRGSEYNTNERLHRLIAKITNKWRIFGFLLIKYYVPIIYIYYRIILLILDKSKNIRINYFVNCNCK